MEVVRRKSGTTDNDYAGDEFEAPTVGGSIVAFEVENTGANSLDYDIEGSVSGKNWENVKAEAAVATETFETHSEIDAPFRMYRVRVKSTVADTPTGYSIWIYAK